MAVAEKKYRRIRMRQAILITAYKDIPLLRKIISYFDSDFEVFIHIDKKCQEDYHDLMNISHVHLFNKYKIAWGAFNHLKAILLLMREAYSNTDLEYFHLITGSDFPILPLAAFKDYCERYRKDNYVEHFPLPHPDWGKEGGMDRIKYYWIQPSYRVKHRRLIYHTIKIQHRLGINRSFRFFGGKLYGGGTYWSVSREAIEIALNYIKKHPKYLRRFHHTSIAEEICLPTIWCNSNLPLTNNYMRYIDWGTEGANPKVLTENDYDKIVASGALFARKIASGVSDKLIETLKYHE